jgi:hypothetical protein
MKKLPQTYWHFKHLSIKKYHIQWLLNQIFTKYGIYGLVEWLIGRVVEWLSEVQAGKGSRG